jgi:uncharacterized membrane protein
MFVAQLFDYIFYKITNSIFDGTEILVPLLFLMSIFKLQIPFVNKNTLIYAVNTVLLFGSLFIVGSLYSMFYGPEYEQYTFSCRLFKSVWTDVFFIFIFPHGILRQLLWIKKFRASIISSVVILILWFLQSQIIILFGRPQGWHTTIKPPLHYYLEELTIYVVIVGLFYFFRNRKTQQQ